MSELKNELEQVILESPLSVHGVEETLPALEQLLKELRREEFWEEKKRKRRLSEEQMIRAWSTYRQDLRELRERMRQRQQAWDDLLTWLVMFMIEHTRELARTSVLYTPSFQDELDYAALQGWETPENALVMRLDYQQWAVEWLREALRDKDLGDLDVNLASTGGSDGDGNCTQEPSPKPKQPDDPEIK